MITLQYATLQFTRYKDKNDWANAVFRCGFSAAQLYIFVDDYIFGLVVIRGQVRSLLNQRFVASDWSSFPGHWRVVIMTLFVKSSCRMWTVFLEFCISCLWSFVSAQKSFSAEANMLQTLVNQQCLVPFFHKRCGHYIQIWKLKAHTLSVHDKSCLSHK